MTPLSWAMICWVLRESWTESSVGRARASSLEFTCSDWVPPRTADSACIVVRMTLLSGCCAVSVTPAVWVWNLSIQDFGFWAPKRSRMILAHMRRAARNLATSSSRSLWATKKNESLEAKLSTLRPASTAAWTYAMALAKVNASSWTAVAPASRMW